MPVRTGDLQLGVKRSSFTGRGAKGAKSPMKYLVLHWIAFERLPSGNLFIFPFCFFHGNLSLLLFSGGLKQMGEAEVSDTVLVSV